MFMNNKSGVSFHVFGCFWPWEASLIKAWSTAQVTHPISFLCLHLLSNKGVSSGGLWLGVCAFRVLPARHLGGEKKGESYFINFNFFSVARIIIWRGLCLWLPSLPWILIKLNQEVYYLRIKSSSLNHRQKLSSQCTEDKMKRRSIAVFFFVFFT